MHVVFDLIAVLTVVLLTSASRGRLERFSDKLRDLLRRDAQYLTYKTFVYGKCLCQICF